MARSLRIQRTNTLLVLQPCIDNAFYPALLRGIEETSLAYGYSVMVGFTDKSEKHREAYADLMSNGRVDGVIVIDGGARVDGITGPKPEVPAVQVLDLVYGGAVPAGRVDDQQVADIAVSHLASLGHRRIAHISGPEQSIPAMERKRGFLAAMARLGLAVDDDLVKPGDNRRQGAAEAMKHFLSLPKPPTAVFAASDCMGCAAMVGLGMALAQPKRRVIVITGDGEMLMALGALATIAAQQPRNLSIVVMDNEHYGETGMQVTHTALGVDMAGMAKAAGFRAAATVHTMAELKSWIPKIYSAGPVFVDLKVTTDRAPLVLPPRDGTLLKLRFRQALLGEA